MGAHGGQRQLEAKGIAAEYFICDGVVWHIHYFSFKWLHEQRILVVMLNGMPYTRIDLKFCDTENLAREFSCNWATEFFSNGLASVAKFRRDIR